MALPIYKYQDENSFLRTASTNHHQKLKQTLNKQFSSKQEQNLKYQSTTQTVYQASDQKQKEKKIEAAVQLELLKRIAEINNKEKELQEKLLK